MSLVKKIDKPPVKIQLLDKLKTPPMNEDSLAINVKRFFTDIAGTVLDKTTVPAALQTQYPFFVFGEFDREAGYLIGHKIQPPYTNDYKYLCSFIYGVNNPFFFGFSPVADIQSFVTVGDMCIIYTDNLLTPTYFIWLVLHCPKTSLASIQSNTKTGYGEKVSILNSSRLHYVSDNVRQWDIPLVSWISDPIGNYKYDFIMPADYRTPETVNNQFADMKMEFPLNQYRGFGSYILFDTDVILLNFKIRKLN